MQGVRGWSRVSAALLAVAFVVVGSPLWATGVTLPDTGVDIPGTVTAMVTFLGTAVTAILAAYAAFRALKIAMHWFSHIGG